jgi:hypothetical protein
MNPDFVTQRLGLAPTKVNKKGQTRHNRFGRTRVVPLNIWFLSSEGKSSSLDLRRHLDWLLDTIAPATHQLREFQKVPGIKMDVNCIWWSAHAQGGPTLWPSQMRRLADLNLECGFDISFFGDD